MEITQETKALKTNHEPFVDAMVLCQLEFAEVYREYVREYYSEYMKDDPEQFPFLHQMLWAVIFRNRMIEVHVFKDDMDHCEFHDGQLETQFEVRDRFQLPPHIQKQQDLELLGRTEESMDVLYFRYGKTANAITPHEDNVTEDPADMPMLGRVKARELAKEHGEKARKQKEERFNLFGLEALVPQVKSSSFEYELGESIAAYKAGLYLAAGATAGIALENILRIIIERKMGSKELPPKTYIGDSVVRLDKKQVLPGRLRSRVWEKRGIRNSHSHTNEDPVRRETVESLLLVIKDLIPIALH